MDLAGQDTRHRLQDLVEPALRLRQTSSTTEAARGLGRLQIAAVLITLAHQSDDRAYLFCELGIPRKCAVPGWPALGPYFPALGVWSSFGRGGRETATVFGDWRKVRLLLDALWAVRVVAGGRARNAKPEPPAGTGPQMSRRDLAQAMRQLPGRYTDRLDARTLDRITRACAAGQWEKAVLRLISALRVRAQRITAAERDDLRALLQALRMPGDRVDTLALHP